MIQQREQERKQENLRSTSYITEEKKEGRVKMRLKGSGQNILGQKTNVTLPCNERQIKPIRLEKKIMYVVM